MTFLCLHLALCCDVHWIFSNEWSHHREWSVNKKVLDIWIIQLFCFCCRPIHQCMCADAEQWHVLYLLSAARQLGGQKIQVVTAAQDVTTSPHLTYASRLASPGKSTSRLATVTIKSRCSLCVSCPSAKKYSVILFLLLARSSSN